jgi:hypothetical protein
VTAQEIYDTIDPMCLVDDEIETIETAQDPIKFRLRIWRNRRDPAIVLVSHLPGKKSPALAHTKIANYVWAAYLAHSEKGMRYLQDTERPSGMRVLHLFTFQLFGHSPCRQRLMSPSVREVAWEVLTLATKGQVDR